MVVILNAYFKSNDSGLSSTTSYLKWKLSLIIFTGLLNVPSLYDFFLFIFIPTALLICMENTFWNISQDGDFVKLFKKSFTLYVERGMREKMEADIDILINQGGHPASKEFKARLCKIVFEHYLRKFFLFVFDSSNLLLCINTAHPSRLTFQVGMKK